MNLGDIDLGELLFQTEDFDINGWSRERAEVCTIIANEKLRERLSRCPVVYGYEYKSKPGSIWSTQKDEDAAKGFSDDHTARLVAVTPIVRDTVESLLRELILLDKRGTIMPREWNDLLDRAKRLLEKGTP